jgi:hypothetical protein
VYAAAVGAVLDVLIVALAALSLAELVGGRPLAPWRRGAGDPLLVRGRGLSMLLLAAALATGRWLGAVGFASALLALSVAALFGSAFLRARQGPPQGGPLG